MHLALRAVDASQRNGPALLLLIVRAALELGAGPVIELHRFHVGLEPAGELVLRDVDRPVRRKRHVRQMVHVHLVVQRERVVALAPVVADARPAIDDQRIDLQLCKARGDREPGLPAAHHEHHRIALVVRLGRSPLRQPVRRGEIARVRPALGSQAADLFLVALQLVERREQRPRSRFLIVGRQTQHAAALAHGGLEAEDRLDALRARACHVARRSAIGIGPEAGRPDPLGVRSQLFGNGVHAADRADAPSQRQYIAPMTVGMKQALEQCFIARRERVLEPCEPMVGNRRQGLRSQAVWIASSTRSASASRRAMSPSSFWPCHKRFIERS